MVTHTHTHTHTCVLSQILEVSITTQSLLLSVLQLQCVCFFAYLILASTIHKHNQFITTVFKYLLSRCVVLFLRFLQDISLSVHHVTNGV